MRTDGICPYCRCFRAKHDPACEYMNDGTHSDGRMFLWEEGHADFREGREKQSQDPTYLMGWKRAEEAKRFRETGWRTLSPDEFQEKMDEQLKRRRN